MSRYRLLPVLLLVLSAGACAPQEEAAAPDAAIDESAIRDTIEAREREWSAAFRAGDAMGVANMYTEDGAQVEPAGEWRRGREAIAASMKAQLDTLNVTMREDVPEEIIVAGDYVIEIGQYKHTATTKVGNNPVSSSGRYMVVWRKDSDGQWRIHRDIGSDAPAM